MTQTMLHAPITDYDQAINYLHGRINYERMSEPLAPGVFKLDRMRNLLEHLGNPHLKMPVVHIAGTKGKGTTATIVSEILQASGYRVGLFTSPHLNHYEERVQVNSEMIERTDLVALTDRIARAIDTIDASPGTSSERLRPTYFEVTTALGWLYFEQQQVDIAVLEVGLGGRLDSTNLCLPEVCVITSISKDHMEILGHELWQIAGEKAGIIKPGISVICGVTSTESQPTIARIAHERAAPLIQIDREFSFEVTTATLDETRFTYRRQPSTNGSHPAADSVSRPATSRAECNDPIEVSIPLAGRHQAHNAACAIAAVQQLAQRNWRVSIESIQAGCLRTKWPARIEVLHRDPLVILDAAHNPASIEALLKTLAEHPVSGKKTLIYASTKDKPVEQLLRMLLPEFDSVFLTEFQANPRAMPLAELNQIASDLNIRPTQAVAQPTEAWSTAFAATPRDGLICIAGSFFLASDLRPLLIRQFATTSDSSGTNSPGRSTES